MAVRGDNSPAAAKAGSRPAEITCADEGRLSWPDWENPVTGKNWELLAGSVRNRRPREKKEKDAFPSSIGRRRGEL
jgi:hypothetical protein